MNDVNIKIKEFEYLLDDTFVNEYNKVKEWIDGVNVILDTLNINYNYILYDEFCSDFKKECLTYITLAKDVDVLNTDNINIWLPVVLSSIIMNKLHEHGEKEINLNNNVEN